MFSNKSIGKILRIADNIIIVTGLKDCFLGELVFFNSESSTAVQGFAMSIENNFVRVALIQGSEKMIKAGASVFRSGRVPTTRVGFNMLGAIVSPLGVIINDSDYHYDELVYNEPFISAVADIFARSPSIIERATVTKPLPTGVAAVDCFTPIGCGQRELIIGDSNTGKTSLALSFIINQARISNTVFKVWRTFEQNMKRNVKSQTTLLPCTLVAIGKKRSETVRIKKVLEDTNSLSTTCIVFSSSDDLPSIQYLAPHSGTTIGEWFRDRAFNALIVYDDLSNHAVSLRQLTLLLRRPPGREAYPGDVFLTHSRLLERAGQLSKKLGGGSLTAIPIIETRGGDVSGSIPTNAISITDGQIYLSNTPANRGIRPGIDISTSASRVGSKAQYNAMREVCKNAKRTYSMYKSYENLQKVSTSSNPEVSTAINRGSKLVELTKQGLYETYTLCTQALSMFALSNNYLDSVDISMVKTYFNTFFNGEFASLYLKNKSLAHILYDFDLLESLLIIGSLETIESDLHAIFSQYEQFLALNVQPRLLLIK